mmetsp:Transcript_2921/g.8946  ORF Transcript_2921/g.8946 Transcript_2921/m.8946 type:complete len:265 (-) Transcript_2921:223-1017(-)
MMPAPEPRAVSSREEASSREATSLVPFEWSPAAAVISILAFTRKARKRAIVESHVAKLTLVLGGSRSLRFCTIPECRYRLCGITVAPMIPRLTKMACRSLNTSICGTNIDLNIGASAGLARNTSMAKQAPTIPTRPTTTISKRRKFRDPMPLRKTMTSMTVTRIPKKIGTPNRSFSAIAPPMTSARSHAIMATSAKTHMGAHRYGLRSFLRVAVARSISPKTPSRIARCCRSIAMTFARRITNRSSYWYFAPASRPVAQFPGSM